MVSTDKSPKAKGHSEIYQAKLNLESLPNARINTSKDHLKISKVVHTLAVICDTLSDLLQLL